jgi:CheY-like chemotaxis protein
MSGSPVHDGFRKVLLIDDDAISREVLAAVLGLHGFGVETAEDGTQALQMIAQGANPELILMDTQMPGLSGLELVDALRMAAKARIVAISGSEVSKEIRHAADGFLLKPIQPEALVALLEEETSPEAIASPAKYIFHTDVIDASVLKKFQAMMPAAAVLEIYSAVVDDLKVRLTMLRAAMGAEDLAEVQRIAHAIKGGCAMVGLSSAMATASRLESNSLQDAWPKELSELTRALGELQGILEDGLPS